MKNADSVRATSVKAALNRVRDAMGITVPNVQSKCRSSSFKVIQTSLTHVIVSIGIQEKKAASVCPVQPHVDQCKMQISKEKSSVNIII